MIRIEYEVGGRKYSDPKRMADALMAEIMSEVGKEIATKLRSVRCPDHDEQPAVRVVSRKSESVEFELSGCCEKLIKMAEARIE
jgi:glutamine synthetase type III